MDTKPCFHTSCWIAGTNNFAKITGCLLDTGAVANFISLEAVNAAGLVIQTRGETTLKMADGSNVVVCEYVTFQLFIASVQRHSFAYVKRTGTGTHLLLAQPTMDQLLVQAKYGVGPIKKQEMRWSVTQDETGLRTKRYLLEASPSSSIEVHDAISGLESAVARGATSQQTMLLERLARERDRVAKTKKRLVRLMQMSNRLQAPPTVPPPTVSAQANSHATRNQSAQVAAPTADDGGEQSLFVGEF